MRSFLPTAVLPQCEMRIKFLDCVTVSGFLLVVVIITFQFSTTKRNEAHSNFDFIKLISLSYNAEMCQLTEMYIIHSVYHTGLGRRRKKKRH